MVGCVGGLDESLLVLEEGSSEPKAVKLKELVGGRQVRGAVRPARYITYC
jgi:hypothetical protein